MTQSYDLLITNGICVTPNGIAEADIGVRNGKIVDIGVPSGVAAETVFRRTGIACPAGCHRYPGAFP